MIRSVAEFYGRKRELRRIMSRIGAPTPQSVSLVGERRMGKSSLLWHLSQPDVYTASLEDPETYLFLFMDFQGQQHLDQAGFCRVFSQHLDEIAGDRLELPSVNDLSDLEHLARAVDRSGLRLICLFDEFETVTRNAEFSAEFFGCLRSLANVYSLAYITASRRNLQSLCHNEQISESPFFNIFSEIRVGPMGDDEIHDLITSPSEEAGVPLGAHRDILARLGGNLPFFVQIACSAAFEQLTDADGGEIDEKLVAGTFMEEATSHFNYLLNSFNERELALVQSVATGSTPDPQSTALAEQLTAQGHMASSDSNVQLFSSAFAQFVRDAADTAPTSTQQEQSSGGTPSAGTTGQLQRPKVLLIVAAILLLGLAYVTYHLGAPAGSAAESIRAEQINSPNGRIPLGLQVEFHYRQMDSGKIAGEGSFLLEPGARSAQSDVSLGRGDRYRLSLSVADEGNLYVYKMDADGMIRRLPEGSSSPKPLSMSPGKIELMPRGANEWMKIPEEGGDLTIFLIGAAERDAELEELHQRYRRSSSQRQKDIASKLAETVQERVAVKIEIPLAER